jgi:tetratricopeptide (TPR) repeat protein
MKKAKALALFLLLAAACEKGSAKSADARPAIAETKTETPIAKAKRLALASTREQGAVDRKIADLTKVARVYPDKLDTWIMLGRAWVWKARESSDPGFYLNADACADVALALSPANKLALGLRGLVLLNDHKFREARDLAQSMVDADSDDFMAWGNLSDALLELGDLERAERAAQAMMDLKPSLPAYGRASYFQWLGGDTKSAIESARLAIDAGGDPENAEPRAWMLVQAAMLFWHIGDYQGADVGCEKALAVLRDYPPALVGRGRVALALGNATRAAELFARAYERSPLVETAWLLGESRERAGDAAGAKEAFARAERDGNRGDKRTLSLMYSTRDVNPDEALRLAEEEATVRGGPQTDDALAWALYRNKRFAEAKTAIARARRYGTKDARLMFHEGAIDVALGDRARGRALAAQALAQNPEFDPAGAIEARRLVASR